MALSEVEVNYLKENSSIFETEDLLLICKTLAESVIKGELPGTSASKIAFFSALAIDKGQIKLVIQNRGDSRSRARADSGQKRLRIYYGISLPSLTPEPMTEDPSKEGGLVRIITHDLNSSLVFNKMFAFIYFKGTLKPENLERLLLKPMEEYNTRRFGKPYTEILKKAMDEVDWGSI